MENMRFAGRPGGEGEDWADGVEVDGGFVCVARRVHAFCGRRGARGDSRRNGVENEEERKGRSKSAPDATNAAAISSGLSW